MFNDSAMTHLSVNTLFYLLVLINPFAQVLYMWEVMQAMTWRQFNGTYFRASVLSFGVFAFFALTGDFLFTQVFHVQMDAFEIFGGLIILLIALRYFTDGAGANLLFRGDASDLAPSISLPYMVGPGTIWVSVVIGREANPLLALGGIAAVMLANFLLLAGAHRLVAELEGRKETMAGKYFAILMRTNALFVGAVSVEMIVSGIVQVIQQAHLFQAAVSK